MDASTLTVYLNTSLPSQAAPEDLMEPVDPWTPSFLSVRGCWLHGRGVCCGRVRVVFRCVCELVRVCESVRESVCETVDSQLLVGEGVMFGRIEWAQLGASLGCVRVVFDMCACVSL